MSDLIDITAAPVTITLGGKTVEVKPITIRQIGELRRWAEDRARAAWERNSIGRARFLREAGASPKEIAAEFRAFSFTDFDFDATFGGSGGDMEAMIQIVRVVVQASGVDTKFLDEATAGELAAATERLTDVNTDTTETTAAGSKRGNENPTITAT